MERLVVASFGFILALKPCSNLFYSKQKCFMDFGKDVYDEVEDVFDFIVSLFYCVSTLYLSLKEAIVQPR